MSRFVRVGGAPENTLDTQWNYLYRCSCWTECYTCGITFDINFCEFDSVKAVFNGLCFRCSFPSWRIPGYNCAKWNQLNCCIYCISDNAGVMRIICGQNTTVCCRASLDISPSRNNGLFAQFVDHEIVFTPLSCLEIGFTAMNIPNSGYIWPGSNLPHSGALSTPTCCYCQRQSGWSRNKKLTLCHICGILPSPQSDQGGGNWAIYGQYKTY